MDQNKGLIINLFVNFLAKEPPYETGSYNLKGLKIWFSPSSFPLGYMTETIRRKWLMGVGNGREEAKAHWVKWDWMTDHYGSCRLCLRISSQVTVFGPIFNFPITYHRQTSQCFLVPIDFLAVPTFLRSTLGPTATITITNNNLFVFFSQLVPRNLQGLLS